MKTTKQKVASVCLCIAIFVSVSIPHARASAALAITGTTVITALVGYLSASGITYSSTNATTTVIVDAIKNELDDYFETYFGGFDGFVEEVKSLNQPLGVGVNGGLALSPGLVALFEPVRQWIISNVFDTATSTTVSLPLSGGSQIGWTVNGHQIGATDVFDLTPYDPSISRAGLLNFSIGSQYLCYIPINSFDSFEIHSSCVPDGHFTFTLSQQANSNFKYMEIQFWNADGQKVFYLDSFNTTMPTFIGLGWALDRDTQNYVFCVYESDKYRDDPMITHYTAGRTFSQIGFVAQDVLPGSLTTTYDDTVPVPVVPTGDLLTLDTVLPIVSPIEDLLAEILARIQAGEGETEATTSPQAITIPPPQYGPQSGYMLDLSRFFPFCIPRDIYLALSALEADPVTPAASWTFPLPTGGEYTLDVDLHQWDGVASIARKCELLLFIIGLAVATRKFIKW